MIRPSFIKHIYHVYTLKKDDGSRSEDVILKELKGYEGVIQSDGIEAIANYDDVDWDNNRLERVNRYISLSRHNSLFFGSHEGAKRGCVFYSLACSCRNNGINFFDYLSDMLNKAAALPQGSPVEAYRNLLPDKWIKNKQGQ